MIGSGHLIPDSNWFKLIDLWCSRIMVSSKSSDAKSDWFNSIKHQFSATEPLYVPFAIIIMIVLVNCYMSFKAKDIERGKNSTLLRKYGCHYKEVTQLIQNTAQVSLL